MTESERIIQRIEAMLQLSAPTADMGSVMARANELLQGTLTLLQRTHGPDSPQAKSILDVFNKAMDTGHARVVQSQALQALYGTLRNLRAEVEAGLVGSLVLRSAAESVADILSVAKENLASRNDAAKNIGAALVAVAYEDTIRRMGTALAGVQGRPHLSEVLTALKDKQVLAGASVTTAQGYLKFRNDALHADWDSVSPAVVGSCLAFTEALLAAHFA